MFRIYLDADDTKMPVILDIESEFTTVVLQDTAEVRRIISTLEKVLFKRGPGRESGPGGPPRVYPGCWLTGPAGRGTR